MSERDSDGVTPDAPKTMTAERLAELRIFINDGNRYDGYPRHRMTHESIEAELLAEVDRLAGLRAGLEEELEATRSVVPRGRGEAMSAEAVAKWLLDRGAYLVSGDDGEVMLVLVGDEYDSSAYSEGITAAMSGDMPQGGVSRDLSHVVEFLSKAAAALSGEGG